MNRDTDILARTIYGEARGESISGQEAIASVILNRVAFAKRRGRYWWGNTIAGVCLAPWQFSCWNENDPNRKIIERADDADIGFCICKRIALRAASGLLEDRTSGATHYHTRSLRPKWSVGKSAVISFITTLRHKMRVLMKSFFLPLRLLRRLSHTLRSGKSRTVFGAAVYGWVVSASLLMLTGAFCLVAVVGGPQAPEIIMALAEASPLWGTALGVFGIALVRNGTAKPDSSGNEKKKTK